MFRPLPPCCCSKSYVSESVNPALQPLDTMSLLRDLFDLFRSEPDHPATRNQNRSPRPENPPAGKDDRPSDSRRGDPLAKPPGTADLTLRKAFRPRPALLPLRRLDRPGFGISGKPYRMDSDSQGSNSRTARPATSTSHPFARRRTPPARTVAAQKRWLYYRPA